MPEQPGRTSSRDFAFQSTDQAFGLGGDPSTTPFRSNHSDRYDPESNANVSGAPSNPVASSSANQTPTQETVLRPPDLSAQQQGLTGQSPGAFANYAYSPGGPLVWDWNNSIEFPELAHHYEPQGELVQELQSQHLLSQDFSIPLPVTYQDSIHQSPQQIPSVPGTATQNPLSLPPPPPPRQRPVLHTAMKRKADSEPNSATSAGVSFAGDLQQPAAKRASKSRSSSSASLNVPVMAPAQTDRRTSMTGSQSNTGAAASDATMQPSTELQRRKGSDKGTTAAGRQLEAVRPRKIVEASGDVDILPREKVFPIQIGSELFRLSGASISSDAPSYFSHFFGEQLHSTTGRAGDLRTLYIDRDPVTFRDISLHLQGYHVKPRDGEHFVRLFADAQFYSLPRLTKQLFNMDIFIRIGQRDFQIPRDLFSSHGDSPNFFSLGFAQFFSTPSEVFPGLDRRSLLRPPSILPPAVPNRSGDTFAELLKLLQGYAVNIRDEAHRAELLRDARYFHLKGLEQRLIPCDISFNLARNTSEILIRLEDIRQSGVSFTPDSSTSAGANSTSNTASPGATAAQGVTPHGSKPPTPSPISGAASGSGSGPASGTGSSTGAIARTTNSGTVSYARPYTDDHANTNILILEIGAPESTRLHFPSTPTFASSNPPSLDLRATFSGQTLARITSLFSVVASKMGLPATQPLGLMMMQSGGGVAAQPVSPANSGVSESRVRVRWESDAWVECDGYAVEVARDAEGRVGVRRQRSSHKNHPNDDDEEGSEDEDEATDERDWVWGGPRDSDYEEHEWIVNRGHWRLRLEPVESADGIGRMQVVMCAVRIEAMSGEKARNRRRGFLG